MFVFLERNAKHQSYQYNCDDFEKPVVAALVNGETLGCGL